MPTVAPQIRSSSSRKSYQARFSAWFSPVCPQGAICFAFAVGLLGIAPHLAFSLDVGELAYFKSAYDEDTYSYWYETATPRPDRLVSVVLFQLLQAGLGGHLEGAQIAADFLFPFVCALAALYLAAGLCHQVWTTLLVAVCLLFGQELFSLGSSAVWGFSAADPVRLQSLRNLAPPWSSLLIPNYYTSYFNLFRTPEPQVSWIMLFTYLGFMNRHLLPGSLQPTRRTWWILLCLQVVLGVCYLPVSFPLYCLSVFLIEAMWSQLAVRALSYRLAGVSLCAVLVVLTLWSWLVFLSDSTVYPQMLFPSRLPIVTPSVIYCGLILGVLLGLRRTRVFDRQEFLFGLSALALPLVLMNQQLITGLMITTRDWERIINYPLLVFGCALITKPLLAEGAGITILPKRVPFSLAGWLLVIFLACTICVGQIRVYTSWFATNVQSLAQERALRTIPAEARDEARLVIDKPGLAPLLLVRSHPLPIRPLLHYLDLFSLFIDPLQEASHIPQGREHHQAHLFEFFARNAKTVDEVANLLQREAKSRAGFFVHFLFSLMDVWSPASDHRMLKNESQILRSLEGVVTNYQHYLSSPQAAWSLPTLFVSRRAPDDLAWNPIWENTLLSRASAGQETVYVYRQILRPADERNRSEPHTLIFQLDISAPDSWQLHAAQLQATPGRKALALLSNISQYHYQWGTQPLGVIPGQQLRIQLEANVVQGKMALGVLDVAANAWLATTPLTQEQTRLVVTPVSDTVRVIVSNNNPAPAQSSVLIRGLTVRQKTRVSQAMTKPPLQRNETGVK